jgi:hypothetical protein
MISLHIHLGAPLAAPAAGAAELIEHIARRTDEELEAARELLPEAGPLRPALLALVPELADPGGALVRLLRDAKSYDDAGDALQELYRLVMLRQWLQTGGEPATFTQWLGQRLASSTDAREVARVLLDQSRPAGMTWAAYVTRLGWPEA